MEELEELKKRLEEERPMVWDGFPDIGLYMDQVISYVSRQLITYDGGETLTPAMVNNYIKDGLLPRADGKKYARTHLAYLTAICALKQVLSVKETRALLAAGGRRKNCTPCSTRNSPWRWTARRRCCRRTCPRRSCPAWRSVWLCAAMPTSWPVNASLD